MYRSQAPRLSSSPTTRSAPACPPPRRLWFGPSDSLVLPHVLRLCDGSLFRPRRLLIFTSLISSISEPPGSLLAIDYCPNSSHCRFSPTNPFASSLLIAGYAVVSLLLRHLGITSSSSWLRKLTKVSNCPNLPGNVDSTGNMMGNALHSMTTGSQLGDTTRQCQCPCPSLRRAQPRPAASLSQR